MQRGKRKSPFVGSSEALDGDTGPILYYRYSNLSDILVEGSAPLAPVQLAAGGDGTAQDGVKKKPKREKVKKPKPEVEANGAQKQQQPKQKKPKGPRKLAPEERISGPGNAGEALKIREALGFVPSTAEELAEAEAAAKRAATKPAFTFGFGLGGTTPAAAAAAPVAQPAAKAVPAAGAGRGGSDSGGESDSSSDSESESEDGLVVEEKQGARPSSGSESGSESESESEDEEEAPAAVAAAAAPGGGKGSSSSESEDESSSSESDSGSDSEDEKEGARPVSDIKAAPARPAPAAQPAAAPPAGAAAAAATAAAAAAEDEDGEFVPRRVYVGGMPFSYTEDKVHEYWSYCGEIESMDLMTFPDTGRFRGIVFITFANQEGFDAAMACDGEQCDGQTLKVQRCKWSPKERAARDRARAAAAAAPGAGGQQQAPAPAGQRVERQQQDGGSAGAPAAAAAPDGPGGGQRQQGGAAAAPKTEGYNVAYVGNIAFEADEKELLRLFEGYNVTKVRLHTDKDTGRSKGFAHIHFKDAESLDRALALNGTQLHGRKIKMGYAQPKKGQ